MTFYLADVNAGITSEEEAIALAESNGHFHFLYSDGAYHFEGTREALEQLREALELNEEQCRICGPFEDPRDV